MTDEVEPFLSGLARSGPGPSESGRHSAARRGEGPATDGRARPLPDISADAPAPDGLRGRIRALNRLVSELGLRVPEQRLAAARDLIGRAGQRLELSGRHTVIALAGTTGSGKSTLFNALTGLDLSRVGVRRPTTTEVHACVWDPSGSEDLLEWLSVPDRRRMARESALDGDDQAELRGLVLMDLPDFDSIDQAHRHEVDRLVGVVDMVIWVLDPQKYADRSVHERYLQPLGARGASTAVVLNQVDRLAPADVEGCAEDLRRLLVDDGLPASVLYVASAHTGVGVEELRKVLAGTIADRQAAVRRLGTDLGSVAAGLADLIGPDVQVATAAPLEPLADELAELAGVPGLLDGAVGDYGRRGRRATGWLFVRRVLGGRDPKRRLEQERYDLDWLEADVEGGPAGEGEDELPSAVESSSRARDRDAGRSGPQVGLSDCLRRYVGSASSGLPAPWPGAVRSAVSGRVAELAERLQRLPDRAAARPRPVWWVVAMVVQWLLGACAAVGAVWLVAMALGAVFGFSVPSPSLGALPLAPLLLVVGLVLGPLAGVAVVPAVRSGAREWRRRLEEELRTEVTVAARDCVVNPVREELYVYQKARSSAQDLRGSIDRTGDPADTQPRTLT